MKVLMINGSPRQGSNTGVALAEMESVFVLEDIEVETVQIGNKDIRGCIACGSCYTNHRCVFDDEVNEVAEKLKEADGLVVGTPVYYASANSTTTALLDRLFYSTANIDMRDKVGCAVVAARRSGLTATFDQINKYFTISGMPVASSVYWNNIHGREPGEAIADAEGVDTVHMLAENMVFLMRSIALGKEKYGLPEQGDKRFTHFVRDDLLDD